jgi:hypothetical protein
MQPKKTFGGSVGCDDETPLASNAHGTKPSTKPKLAMCTPDVQPASTGSPSRALSAYSDDPAAVAIGPRAKEHQHTAAVCPVTGTSLPVMRSRTPAPTTMHRQAAKACAAEARVDSSMHAETARVRVCAGRHAAGPR